MSAPRASLSPATVRAVVRALRECEQARKDYFASEEAQWAHQKARPSWKEQAAFVKHLAEHDGLRAVADEARRHHVARQADAIARLVDSIVRPAFAALQLDLDALVSGSDEDLVPILESSIRLAANGGE